jgi:hypothetical protein
MNTTYNPVRKSILMVLLFVIAFAAFATMACDDGPITNPNPANIVMSEKSGLEQTVGDLLAGDNPQNVLSGGNP